MRPNKSGDAVARALLLIKRHPEVRSVAEPKFDETTGATTIDVVFNVNLPSDWKSNGVSPFGVGEAELVRYVFPAAYPLDAPVVSLRPDFNREHPHIQPYLYDG